MSMKEGPLRPSALLVGALACACVLAVAGWRLWPARDDGRTPAEAGQNKEPVSKYLVRSPCQLADGLFLLGDISPSAVYVVETRDGLVLIDSGLEGEYDKIVEGFAKLRLDLRQIRYILLTHAHGDHTMGAERLRRETGAQVCIGREDAPCLRAGGPWEAIFSKFDMPVVTLHPTAVDVELSDGQTFSLGEARITALSTPGHTRGSFCFLVENRGTRALFTGDTIMSLSNGLGTYSAYLAPKYRGNVDEYLQSLRTLRGLPVPDMVLPGHPQSDPIAQNPRLTAKQWASLIDRGIDELELLTRHYEEDGADFLDGTPKKLAEGLFYLGDAEDKAVYSYLTGDATLLFDAAGGDAPSRFLADAWKELGVEPPPVAAVLLTSCRAENLTGLRALVEATGCRVVVAPDGVGIAAEHCPEDTSVIPVDQIDMLGCRELGALATPGRDSTAAAYHLRAGSDQVLISGDIPIEVSKSEMKQVFAALRDETWDAEQMEASLAALKPLRPKLWLSHRPLHERNANLYDLEWQEVLAMNREMIRMHRGAQGDRSP
ncbi:MAG TPA: MBL fold metallo-hydrolase [Pirellulales bacterium]|nr:MBL fold metallo-hydrolase [Pirellulales bacterium]